MSGVATAIAGSAIVGGAMSYYSGKQAADAASSGSANALAASQAASAQQLAEIRRQYDYQQKVLLPQIQQQYNAQRAYTDLLGIGGPSSGPQIVFSDQVPPGSTGGGPGVGAGASGQGITGPQGQQVIERNPKIAQVEQQIADVKAMLAAGGSGGAGTQRRTAQRNSQLAMLQEELGQLQASDRERVSGGDPRMGAPGSSGLGPGNGAFVDPNLNPTQLADTATLPGQVRNTLLAGTSQELDPYGNYVKANPLAAAGGPEESVLGRRANDVRLASGAAGTGVYGENFQTSPGYAFAVEEAGRATDRIRSAGGPNIGGRAIMEAQRRAEGIANQEYYNWAGGRERDLGRLAGAEATDIQRGDIAYGEYERQRLADLGRGDEAYQNYLQRQAGDVARLDTAASQTDRLQAADLQRQDQGYYNYLASLRDVAGFGGGPAASAVNVAGAQGQQVSNVYGNQGQQSANIYGDLGTSNANIAYAQGAGINNAIQSGVSNYVTYKGSQNPAAKFDPYTGKPIG